MDEKSLKILDTYCQKYHSNVSQHLAKLLRIYRNPEGKLCRTDALFLEDIIEYELVPEAKAAMEELAAAFKKRR